MEDGPAHDSICEVAPAIDGRGRRLLTRAPALAGDLLLREPPYAAVPFDPSATCGAGLVVGVAGLLRCGRCKVARYADRAAQAADWSAHHKAECAALAAAAAGPGRLPSPTVRLAARCLWRAQATGSTAALDALESHWADLPPARAALYAEMAMAVLRFMRGGGGGREGAAAAALPHPKAVAALISRLAINAHTIQAPGTLDRVGIGLYVGQGAMANHGDGRQRAPTAVQAFCAGGVLELRALCGLEPGEEVTVSYVDPSLPRPARRAALLAGYFFDVDGLQGAARPPPPPPSAEWAAPDGSVSAVAFRSRPPSAGDDPAPMTALAGCGLDAGAMAWLEEEAGEAGGGDAATSFLVEDEEEGEGGKKAARPRRRVRVEVWGCDGSALARLATALAGAERAAEAVRACLDGGRPDVSGAVAAARAGAAALAALSAAGGGPALAPTHSTVGRLAAARLRAAVADGDWAGALAAAREAGPPAAVAVPPASPLRARLAAERAKLAALAGEGGRDPAADAEALAAAQEAVAALRVCCPAAPLRAEMEGLVDGLRAEAAVWARLVDD